MPGAYRNVLLRRMGQQALGLIEPWLEPVPLHKLDRISSPGQPTEFVYFVEEGILSVISHLDEERDVELGVIGREGMSGEEIVYGDDRSAFTVHVEMPGSAFRLPSHQLRLAMDQSRDLHQFLLCFARAQKLQLASTAAANQRASIEERLARWILMGFDRIDGDSMMVTHDDLAWLLGARRPSVTDALHKLEGRGFIRSVRSEVILRDAQGLRQAASGSYGLAEQEYARLIGIDFRGTRDSVNDGDVPQFFTTNNSPEDAPRPD